MAKAKTTQTPAPKVTKRVTRSTTFTSPAKPKAEKVQASVPHVAAPPAPPSEPPTFTPRTEPTPPAARGGGISTGNGLTALAVVALIAVGAFLWNARNDSSDSRHANLNPSAPKSAQPAKIQAVEVEFIPLGATKVSTHEHTLHGTSCEGKAGKKVKVRITHPVTGAKGWDWYNCPSI